MLILQKKTTNNKLYVLHNYTGRAKKKPSNRIGHEIFQVLDKLFQVQTSNKTTLDFYVIVNTLMFTYNIQSKVDNRLRISTPTLTGYYLLTLYLLDH